jgi:hypothetical protein
VSPAIHPLVWREVNLIGSNMALRLEQASKSGVIYGFAYDAYWPGGTMNTAWWKNISGLLTEVASVDLATPIEVPPGELSGGRKGLIEYGPQTNFPNPWPGGWWRLRDIMDYERLASDAILETCAERREDFLRNALTRAQAAIASFGPREAFRVPADQRDPAQAQRLAKLMQEHGVEVQAATNGDVWIPLAQPYGNFVKEMLETQRYPEVKLVPGEQIVQPYDVSTWSLPLMMGVEVERAELPEGLAELTPTPPSLPTDGKTFALTPGSPEDAKLVNAGLRGKGKLRIARSPVEAGGHAWPAGTVFFDSKGARAAAKLAQPGQSWTPLSDLPAAAEPLEAPRVGLYKPWRPSMDEGWTRFVLEQYGFDTQTLDNATIRSGELNASYDAIVLPDVGKEIIEKGQSKPGQGRRWYSREVPPEYRGGLEKEGAKALEAFVEAGGTLVALASSTEYVLDLFPLPVRNTLAKVGREEFSSAGALVKVEVRSGHPVTYGLPDELPIFLGEPIAFQTTHPGAGLQRWVLAAYPNDRRDIPLSGWIRGHDKLERRAAAVATTWGKGKIVLLGFRPQHRAQTPATFPFLFNALYGATM